MVKTPISRRAGRKEVDRVMSIFEVKNYVLIISYFLFQVCNYKITKKICKDQA